MLHGPSVSPDDRKIVRDLPAATNSQATFGSDPGDPNRAYTEKIRFGHWVRGFGARPLLAAWQQLDARDEIPRTIRVTHYTAIL